MDGGAELGDRANPLCGWVVRPLGCRSGVSAPTPLWLDLYPFDHPAHVWLDKPGRRYRPSEPVELPGVLGAPSVGWSFDGGTEGVPSAIGILLAAPAIGGRCPIGKARTGGPRNG